MRPIGFSTGALARGDVERGLALQRGTGATAVELSALRERELAPLVDALPRLDLSGFAYVSVHAPSALREVAEPRVLELLSALPVEWPIVVHPEVLLTPERWRPLGARLCIENMDDRKPAGKSIEELRPLFLAFPEATFCLDVGHAWQIDPSVGNAVRMLDELAPRLRQVHVSEVGRGGEHLALGAAGREALRRVLPLLPIGCPLILESAVGAERVEGELAAVAATLGDRSQPAGAGTPQSRGASDRPVR